MNKKLLDLLSLVPDFKGLYAKSDGVFAKSTDTKPESRNWFRVSASTEGPAEIYIFDQIGYHYWDDSGTGAADYAEALANIPSSRPINLMINSPGGNLWDALAISAINEQRGNVTCYVLGSAASAASVIAVKCKKLVMAKSSLLMIHNAQSFAAGNQYDMEKARECLVTHDQVLASLYAKKSGKPESMFMQAMKAETWYSPEQAYEAGLCDEISESLQSVQNNFDFSKFRNNPNAPKALGTSVKPAEAANIMNRKKAISILAAWGVTPPDNATDEQIFALIEAGKPVAASSTNTVTQPVTQPVVNGAANDQLSALIGRFDAIEKRDKAERTARITAAVDSALADQRIPTNSREEWLAKALADETVLNLIPSAPPSWQSPISVAVTSPDVKNIAAEYKRCDQAKEAFMRGNDVSMSEIMNGAKTKASHFQANREKIIGVWNTNTIAVELKRHAIMQDGIKDFVRRLLTLTSFSTIYANPRLEGTDKVEVPFFDLDATASTDWVAGTGYVAGDTTVAKREITVDKRKYQGLKFTSSELARQPFLALSDLFKLKAEKLASDVVANVLSVITAANYGAPGFAALAAASWDSDKLADVKLACKTWPTVGRSLFVDSAIDTALLKDTGFKFALNAASDSAVKEGRLYPRVYGFDYVENPNIPTNAENLIAFACFKSAILVAMSPIMPSESVRRAGTQYEIIVDPQTGASFEFRDFGDNTLDSASQFVECNYGFAKGNGNALKRFVSA